MVTFLCYSCRCMRKKSSIISSHWQLESEALIVEVYTGIILVPLLQTWQALVLDSESGAQLATCWSWSVLQLRWWNVGLSGRWTRSLLPSEGFFSVCTWLQLWVIYLDSFHVKNVACWCISNLYFNFVKNAAALILQQFSFCTLQISLRHEN